MDKRNAIAEIRRIFQQYRNLLRPDRRFINNLTGGKLYEFYCLANTVEEIRARYGCIIRLVGPHIQFQSSPGLIRSSDPHFEVEDSAGNTVVDIFTDVEFTTLGCQHTNVTDNSGQHELDIIAVNHGVTGKPKHDEILLSVECKSNAKFGKWILKQTLGVRRELSYYSQQKQTAKFDATFGHNRISLNANPSSEYWLAYVDSHGDNYDESPNTFGIEFKHWEP
jgi:hypothetical protein